MSKDAGLEIPNLLELRASLRDKRGVQSAMRKSVRKAGDLIKSEATEIALMKTGNLRKNIKRKPVTSSGDQFVSVVTSDAWSKWKGNDFNYSYYLHEIKKTVLNPTTPGTEPQHIKITLDKNKEKIRDMFVDDILAYFRSKGWDA